MSRTLEYIGEYVGFGVDAIHNWMNATNLPDCETLERLAQLGVAEAAMDRQWVDRLLLHGACPNRITIVEALFPTASQRVKHNLPHQDYRLIGRDELITQIVKSLAPESRDWIIPVEGIGGVGKSALALAIAWRFVDDYDRVPAHQHFSAIIWVSAKRNSLGLSGIQRAKPTLTNIDDIYFAIGDLLGAPRILELPQEKQQREVIRVLRDAGRVLLVVDNLEDVDDPSFAEALGFLRNLPSQTKAVVTTRAHEDLPFPVRLDALKKEDATALITQECATRDVELTESQITDLVDATGRLPLALWWAIGLMSQEGFSVETILNRLANRQDDLLRYIFGASVAYLKSAAPDAYRALLALSFFDTDSGASLPALADILQLDVEASRIAVHKLLNLNLANRVANGARFRMLPLTRAYAQGEAQDNRAWENEARERWIACYQRLVRPAGTRREFKPLLPELNNILGLMQWLVAHKRMDTLAGVYQRVQAFLYAEGSWEKLLEYADLLADWAIKEGRPDVVRLTLYAPTSIFRKRADSERAKAWLDRARLAAIQMDDELLKADTLFCDGYQWDRYHGVAHGHGIHPYAAEANGARANLQKALDIFRRDQPVRQVEALNALGNLSRWAGDYSQAIRYYEEALHIREEWHATAPHTTDRVGRNPTYWLYILKGNLALAAGNQGQFGKAKAELVEILPELADLIDQAEVYAALALYAFKEGLQDDERAFRDEVERIKGYLGLTYPICIEDQEWEMLHGQQEDENIADDEAQDDNGDHAG
jgi:tetratricopeptide (TPR) repeat protein